MARYEALSGNHEKALDIINAVIEKYPVYENEPFAIYIKATVLLSFDDKEKLEEALSTYKKALEIVPDYFFAQLGIANTLIKQEEYDEAEKYLSDVMLVENPSNGYLISYLVHISGLKLKKYEALYAENPTQDTIEKLAQCYLRNNEHDKCIELLLDKEKTGKVCNMLGYGYARKKEYDLAIEYAVESIEKEPKYYAYITLSEIYLAKRQYKMAVENADTGLAAGLPEEGTEIFGKTRLLADKAYAYKELGEYDKALEAVNAAIAINDKMCDLYAGKAEILLDMYDFSEAHNEAGKAMSLAPGWARPYELMLDIFYRADNPEQMEEIFKEVDEMEIKSHGLSFFRGCMAGSVEDYDKCNEILKGLLEEQDLGIWEDRGLQALCRHNLNAENHEAVAQYSLELIDFLKENNFPPEPRAYMYLASAHNELHGPEKELETIIDGLKAMPDSNDLLLEYHFQYDNEESPEVYNTWRRIMEAAPNNPVPYNRMAILYANEDKPKEALDILAQGLAKLPGNINLIGRRAYVYQDIEEYEKSANDCLLVAENPQNQDTWWEKGPMYFEAAWVYWSKLNNAEAAKKYFFLASENDGTNDNWEKGFLADVYERAGEYEKAMAIHDECIEDDPEDECALLSRGELYKEMGEAAKASADFNRLLEVISENEDAGHDSYRYAGTASLAMDNPEKAREYYEKSTEAVKTDGTKGGICFCIHQSWAKYYRYLGDYAKALEKIDLAIGISNSVMNNDLKQEILKAAGM
ncbi:MAG: tetratricopeptide repeat protein [Defluviitaleaceae bacterium]|nr:tetratricopeptide repeat protein [Defluviitaleaceae bacterium]